MPRISLCILPSLVWLISSSRASSLVSTSSSAARTTCRSSIRPSAFLNGPSTRIRSRCTPSLVQHGSNVGVLASSSSTAEISESTNVIVTTRQDLEKMTVKQLKSYVQENGVTITKAQRSKLKLKKDVVDFIWNYQTVKDKGSTGNVVGKVNSKVNGKVNGKVNNGKVNSGKNSDTAPAASSPESGSSHANIESKSLSTDKQRFADLAISSESRRALSEVFKYEFMTEVQSETLPLILEQDRNDCLAKAKTGTGKTLAFMIPTIEKIKETMKNERSSEVHCLVISPTRELAQQISSETEKLLTFHKPHLRKVVTCVGGTNKNRDAQALKGTTPIVVATPGRLLDLLQNGGLADRMANLDTLVLDEADRLLDMGFRPDVERILRLLQPSLKTRQTLLFSATIPNQVNQIASIAMRPNYNLVDTVGKEVEQTHQHVQQQLMVSPQKDIIRNLFSILERETSSSSYKIIVFFTTARLTGLMAKMFNSVSSQTGMTALEIHSKKTQKAREKASEQFRKNKNAIMFSSDVTARGMDYPGVTFVLQVGLTDRSQYIHRLGRTARAGKEGKGGLLLADYEEHHMTKKELTDMPLEFIQVPSSANASDAASRAIQNVAKDETLSVSGEQAYRAWLGYYNSQLKKIGWDKKQLVQQANAWGAGVGLKDQPSLQKRTVGKMGLKGVPGLKIEK
ncbi:hypothetical protein ACHAXR_007650 [Thalassiosira sp. AJA248-18]